MRQVAAAFLVVAAASVARAQNGGLADETTIQVLNRLGITVNGTYSGGGGSPFGAAITWKPGLNLGFNSGHVVGPNDDWLGFFGSPGNGLYFQADPDSNSGTIELDSPASGGSLYLTTGLRADGSGSVIFLAGQAPTPGKTNGYVVTSLGIMPNIDGTAYLGSTSDGFGALHLSSGAVASWNNDAGISRTGPASFAAGNGAPGDHSASMALTTLSLYGKVPTYNGISVAGNGLTSIVAANNVTVHGAINVVTYSVPVGPSDQDFEVSGQVNLYLAGAVSADLQVSYTDTNDTPQVMILPITAQGGTFLAGGLITGTGTYESAVVHIRAFHATTITISVAGTTFTNVSGSASGVIRQLQ